MGATSALFLWLPMLVKVMVALVLVVEVEMVVVAILVLGWISRSNFLRKRECEGDLGMGTVQGGVVGNFSCLIFFCSGGGAKNVAKMIYYWGNTLYWREAVPSTDRSCVVQSNFIFSYTRIFFPFS